jgi:hypothetical protein
MNKRFSGMWSFDIEMELLMAVSDAMRGRRA